MSQILDQGVASILSYVLFHIGATLPKPPAPLKLDLAMAQTKEDLSKAEVKEEVPETPEKQPTPQPAKAVPEQQQPAVAQAPAVAATNSTE